MHKVKSVTAMAVLLGAGLALGACTTESTTKDVMKHPYKEVWSGYSTATPETRAMQDDDFANPYMPYVDAAAELWDTPAGEAKKSCADCHGAPDDAKGGSMGIPMKGVGAKYPAYDPESHGPINVELRIQKCQTDHQKAKPFKYESDELLGMTGLVVMQSRGMKRETKAAEQSDPLYPAWLQGKAFYYQRRGQLDLACKHCHEDNAAILVRAELLSQGQSNGFPTYRLKWQKPGSLHRRFRGCNNNIRSEPYAFGSDEYLALETYLAWRGRGLPIEGPSVRK
ncbi:MAG: sulfur oxidation c-type cytochrome SoxA [Alphaproteobacteria bacterium]|nr:sulfur oxidation c-type cytochrome SoxA [Alphaproteobacteria bacterium]